ncbi:MAG: hypothetical protein ABIO92_10225 [Chloroflexia bacterium]
MPDPKTQRYLGWIAFFGVFASCFGCSLYANNQVRAAVAFLVLAWIILTPVFVYLLRTRRQLKKVSRVQDAYKQQELDALASLGKTLETEEEKE